MQSKQFTTSLSIDEIKSRLSGLDNFKVEQESADELSANVGSKLKYKMMGVFLKNDYQAPISIDADSENGQTTVSLSANSGDMFDTGKSTDFFERGFTEIRELLEAK